MEFIEEHIFEEVDINPENKFVLKNVKICGTKSDNNRKYPIEVLFEGKDLYHNVPVYIGHSKFGQKRLYTERVGVIKNPTCKENGLYGELHLNPYHPQSNALQWDYEHNSKQVSLSHEAKGETYNGVVKKLLKVDQLCLVTEAATTESLKEEAEINEIEIIKTELVKLNTDMAGLKKENERLIEEINEIKSKKPIRSVTPQYEPEKFDSDKWVKELKG